MDGGPLDLSRMGIEDVPFSEIPVNTAWLVLSNNKIMRIPEGISRLRRIERMALNDNSISEVSGELAKLTRLSWIDMTRNRLKSLPQGLLFRKLVGLGLSENEFEDVPECIFGFRALRKLGFFSNKVRLISPKIQNLQSLVKLDLSNNLIEELPDEICHLRSLAWLNVSNNRLRRLPARFGELSNLEELGLGNNSLRELPSLDDAKRLRVLSAFGNEITDFEIESSSVRKLDLSSNRLSRFPPCLLRIRSLHTVSLRGNAISDIPMAQVVGSGLRSIDLRFNRLGSIPLKFLRSVHSCQVLLLEGNEFAVKEDVFPGVPSLQSICLNSHVNSSVRARCEVGPEHVCDFCDRAFVSDPIKMYFLASLELEERFCLEEEVCTNRCYLDSIRAKGSGRVFCSRA